MNILKSIASYAIILLFSYSCDTFYTIIKNRTGYDIYVEIQYSKNDIVSGEFKSDTSLILDPKIDKIEFVRFKYNVDGKEKNCSLNRVEIAKLSYNVEGRKHLILKKC